MPESPNVNEGRKLGDKVVPVIVRTSKAVSSNLIALASYFKPVFAFHWHIEWSLGAGMLSC